MRLFVREVINKCHFQKNRIEVRYISSLTNEEVCEKRNKIFNAEKERQKALITRIEKIEVNYLGVPEKCTLLMNKNISTPFDCTMHISEMLRIRSVLPLVDNELWDMYRPLENDCTLDFLHFKIENPFDVNKAFWRSCSFMLGMIVEKAFKNNIYVQLHSWPKPDVKSGSFVYDVNLNVEDWEPRLDELRTLSRMLQKLAMKDLKFERLAVPLSVAQHMFEDNRFKSQQLSSIANHSKDGDTVVVYRLDDHIDISYGPMISSTNHLGFVTVAAVHKLDTSEGLIYRFQGVAIPKQLPLNTFAFKILVDRAKKVNTVGLPSASENIPIEDHNAIEASDKL